jgi:NADPH-dependent F420 reductase
VTSPGTGRLGATQAPIAILGGTGPLGRGLAARLTVACYDVVLGSRDGERAHDAADSVAQTIPAASASTSGQLLGRANAEACESAEIVIAAVPYDAQESTLTGLGNALAGKLVVNCANALTFDEAGPKAVAVPGGSAAQECQQLVPRARVVSAFHELPAPVLADLSRALDFDVLVSGDDRDDKEVLVALIDSIEGLRGVDAGPLRNSAAIENLLPVLIAINSRYRTRAGLRIQGLD